jgi:thiamine-monophosphate kinase
MRSEGEIIRRLQRRFPAGGAVRVGIGDDAAVLAGDRRDWVVTTDWLIEGVHFRRDTHPPRAVGWKALARSLSDLAATAAQPRYALVALAVPSATSARWVDEFFAGVKALAGRYGVRLVGGDLSSGPQIAVDVQALGLAQPSRAIRRHGARPGHVLFVSGTLGLSHLGLAALQRGRAREFSRAVRFHLYPRPQVRLGAALARRGATAMIDVSDGLSTDLARLCEASGVGARLLAERVPLARLTVAEEKRLGVTAWELAANGGEDYELLFTLPRRKAARLPKKLAGARLTPIGEITRGRGLTVVDAAGRARPLPVGGWNHFRRR